MHENQLNPLPNITNTVCLFFFFNLWLLNRFQKQQIESYQLNYTGMLSLVQLCMTIWNIACQAPLSMELSRQEYWSGLSFPSLRDLPNPGVKPCLLRPRHWQADSLPLSYPRSPSAQLYNILKESST